MIDYSHHPIDCKCKLLDLLKLFGVFVEVGVPLLALYALCGVSQGTHTLEEVFSGWE